MGDFAKVTHINDLPTELLVEIFSSYAKSEGNAKLCTILAKVSTAWREAALAKSLWTEVSFTADEFSHGYSWFKDEDFCARISCAKTLNFKYPALKPTFLFIKKLNSTSEPYGGNSILQDLGLDYCDEENTPPPFSFDLPTLCPQITGIRIHETYPLPTGSMIFTWIEKYNTNLTSLSINRALFCSPPQDLTLLSQKIAEFCPNMTIFKYLGAEYLKTELEILDLNSLQAGCPKMKELCLKYVSFMDDDDSTSCFPHLETFCFAAAPHREHHYSVQQDIVRVLRGSKELKELELIGPIFKCETMLQLPFKSLKKLKFQYSGKTNDLWDVLCRWKHTLTEIDVVCNEESQKCLFRYIEQYGKDNLESLKLMGRPQELEQIKSILGPCAKLRYLYTCIGPVQLSRYLCSRSRLCLKTREQICRWLDL